MVSSTDRRLNSQVGTLIRKGQPSNKPRKATEQYTVLQVCKASWYLWKWTMMV